MSSQSSIFAPSTLNSLRVLPSRVTANRVSLLPPSLCVQNTFVYWRLATIPELSVMAGFARVPPRLTPGGISRSAPQPKHIDVRNTATAKFDWPLVILTRVWVNLFEDGHISSVDSLVA